MLAAATNEWHIACFGDDHSGAVQRSRRSMQSFAPEFARFWLPSQGAGAGAAKADRGDDDTPAQQAALEELAERVSLARTIT
jgi:hypothetical protein